MESKTHSSLRVLLQNARENSAQGKRETRQGAIYEPKPFGMQIVFLIGAFFGGPAIGWISGLPLESLSSAGQTLLYIPPTLVFFLGYALWSARLAAIAFDMIGKSILRALFLWIFKRKKPERLEDILPDRDKLERMVVRAQKAGWSFFTVAVFVGTAAGGVSLFSLGVSGAAVVLSSCLLWGYLLGMLARRGYLPFPESGD
jgi:hypothetical protein